MRRTHWAVFTSMNPRQPAWRTLHERLPADQPVQVETPDSAERRETMHDLPDTKNERYE